MSKLVQLQIDGQSVSVPAGTTILEAARRLGIEIPTLCFYPGLKPSTSCLVCLVEIEVNGRRRLTPSCGTPVSDGMIVRSEVPEVHEARRTALELLLSDHLGDCLSPCQRICPLSLAIPAMLRSVQNKRIEEAIRLVREALPLPSVTSSLCPAPCEQGCRRGVWDQPVAVREEVGYVILTQLQRGVLSPPDCRESKSQNVLIVGSGPAGLSAAWQLRRLGYQVEISSRLGQPGGTLRRSVMNHEINPDLWEFDLAHLRAMGIRIGKSVELKRAEDLDRLRSRYDAVILALGEEGRSVALELGLADGNGRLKIHPESRMSQVPGVFIAGATWKRFPNVTRVMEDGVRVASIVDSWLSRGVVQVPVRTFSCSMGRVDRDTVREFLKLANLTPRIQTRLMEVPNPVEAGEEGTRCLHCDCRASGRCALQHWAQRYGADPHRYNGKHRLFQIVRHGPVLYEPGKCILCGICVQITEAAREELGLTFVGRGFHVRVGVPFGAAIAEGMKRVARQCVEACPTGALSFVEDEEWMSAERLKENPR